MIAVLTALAVVLAAPPSGTLTLEEAYALAEANSEALRGSAATVRRASLLRAVPWTTMIPTASATGESVSQTEVVVDGTLVTPAEQLRGRVDVEQPLFLPGFLAERRAGAMALDSAKEEDRRLRQQLMMDSVTAFIGVLSARQQVQVAAGALARAEAQEKSAEGRAKAGAALKTTVLISTIDRRRAQLDQLAAQSAQREAEAAFERLFRVAPPETLVLPAPPSLPLLPAALEGASRRPDVRALELIADEARQRAKAASARVLRPTASLLGSVEAFDPPARNREELELRAIAQLKVPLSKGGADILDARIARAEATVADEDAKALRVEVAEEVKRAFIQLEQSQQATALLREQVRDARENYGLVESQFRLGGATPLEVANAQVAFTEAETLELVASYDLQLAAYRLLFASGQLDL